MYSSPRRQRLGDPASTERKKLPIYWQNMKQAGMVTAVSTPQGVCVFAASRTDTKHRQELDKIVKVHEKQL